MIVTKNERGFPSLCHDVHPPGKQADTRLLTQSSMISDEYPDAFCRPGTSYLWVGVTWHLNREEVAEMVKYMQNWLETGDLNRHADNENN